MTGFFIFVQNLAKELFLRCTKLHHEESFRGVLKQYGQKGESADFVDPLLAPYFLLRETLQKGKSQDLANFLPLYEIYEEEGQKGSFWIWIAGCPRRFVRGSLPLHSSVVENRRVKFWNCC